jgi:hypothetical protein
MVVRYLPGFALLADRPIAIQQQQLQNPPL